MGLEPTTSTNTLIWQHLMHNRKVKLANMCVCAGGGGGSFFTDDGNKHWITGFTNAHFMFTMQCVFWD